MAGDWIKIEHSLPNKPEVMELARILNVDEMAVVGHLVCFWTWVDQNLSPECPSASGTKRGLDRVAGRDGFVDAMISVGWLVFQDGKVEIPNYDHHLSESAKKRSEESRRKRNQRQKSQKCPADVGTKSGQNTGPEKRREEKSIRKNITREVPVHESELNIPASVNTPDCRASMDRLFSAMNKRRADTGEYNLSDFALQANWNIAAQIGPERLASVVEMAIAREWRSLVVPDDGRPKTRQRSASSDSEDYTADEEILWAQIAAACKDTSAEGDKSRKAFDKLTKEIMTQIGGSAAIRELNLGEKPEREMKKRFVLTRRQRLKLEPQEAR